MTIQAPAKINLVLRILAKRADGYHDIETVMAPISLADVIEIEIAPGAGISLQCDDPDLPAGPGNLVWRAVEAFENATGQRAHTRILLQKNIPHGAGLGGGSSDAAAVLKALDELHKTHLGSEKLEEIASALGSDIPFFIRCRPAVCRGRGEMIQDAGEIAPAQLLLLKPPFPVSTAWAYKSWDARLPKSGLRQSHGNLELENDLEQPVFRKYLLLPAIKAWLLQQDEVSAALMSGSGSTMLAILRNGEGSLAERAKERFGQLIWTDNVEIISC